MRALNGAQVRNLSSLDRGRCMCVPLKAALHVADQRAASMGY